MSKFRIVLISAVASSLVSAVAGFAHADRAIVAGVRIPFGLLLALSVCVVTLLWLNREFQTRLAGTVFTVVWVLVTLRMAVESANKDLVFSVTWYSTAYIIAGAILLSMTAVLPVMHLPTKPEPELSEPQA